MAWLKPVRPLTSSPAESLHPFFLIKSLNERLRTDVWAVDIWDRLPHKRTVSMRRTQFSTDRSLTPSNRVEKTGKPIRGRVC
jgi:hypothetical protein